MSQGPGRTKEAIILGVRKRTVDLIHTHMPRLRATSSDEAFKRKRELLTINLLHYVIDSDALQLSRALHDQLKQLPDARTTMSMILCSVWEVNDDRIVPDVPDSNPMGRGRLLGLPLEPLDRIADQESVLAVLARAYPFATSHPVRDPLDAASASVSAPNLPGAAPSSGSASALPGATSDVPGATSDVPGATSDVPSATFGIPGAAPALPTGRASEGVLDPRASPIQPVKSTTVSSTDDGTKDKPKGNHTSPAPVDQQTAADKKKAHESAFQNLLPSTKPKTAQSGTRKKGASPKPPLGWKVTGAATSRKVVRKTGNTKPTGAPGLSTPSHPTGGLFPGPYSSGKRRRTKSPPKAVSKTTLPDPTALFTPPPTVTKPNPSSAPVQRPDLRPPAEGLTSPTPATKRRRSLTDVSPERRTSPVKNADNASTAVLSSFKDIVQGHNWRGHQDTAPPPPPNPPPDDEEPPALPVANGWAARDPTASLDVLRQNAWHWVKGGDGAYIASNISVDHTLTGKEASKTTTNFFGPNWVGGCLQRIIDITRDRETIDVAITAGRAAGDDELPEEFRTLMRSLRDVKVNQRGEATHWLRHHLSLLVFSRAWNEVQSIMGPDGDPVKRARLLSVCLGEGDHSTKAHTECMEAVRKFVCVIRGAGTVASYNLTRSQAHLVQAVVDSFGTGGLLFLPPGRDPYRQLHDKRTALYSIMSLIERSGNGHGDWLGRAAQLIKEEIVDRIGDGELLSWPDGVLEKLTADKSLSIIEAVTILKESRRAAQASGSGDGTVRDSQAGSGDGTVRDSQAGSGDQE